MSMERGEVHSGFWREILRKTGHLPRPKRGWEDYSLIHSGLCLTTGPKPPPIRFLHIVRSRASSFKSEYLLLSLRSSNSFLGRIILNGYPRNMKREACSRLQLHFVMTSVIQQTYCVLYYIVLYYIKIIYIMLNPQILH